MKIENLIYALIGFLIGAYLITHVKFKVSDSDIIPFKKLCQSEVQYYAIDYAGNIEYVYCEGNIKKQLKKFEPEL